MGSPDGSKGGILLGFDKLDDIYSYIGCYEVYKYVRLDGCNNFMVVWGMCYFNGSKYGNRDGSAL